MIRLSLEVLCRDGTTELRHSAASKKVSAFEKPIAVCSFIFKSEQLHSMLDLYVFLL